MPLDVREDFRRVEKLLDVEHAVLRGREAFSLSATRAATTPVARPSPRPHAEQEWRRPPFPSASATTANPSDPKRTRPRTATRASRVPRCLRTRSAPVFFSRVRRRVAAAESKHSLVAARPAPMVRARTCWSAKSKR